MAYAGKLGFQMDLKASADKFYGSIRDNTTLFPKIFPDKFKSIQVLEGDGWSVGTVRFWTYALDNITESQGNLIDLVAKEKIEAADEANKSATFSIFEGDLSNFYKNIIVKLYVTPKSEGSSVNWCMDFEKVSKEVPDPNLYQDFVINIFKDLDAYLCMP
ncbi:hypothetical protein HHK36_009775 [Tetracentron sinense]|uniref:Bet v I/Major latex protein domain-containing protein n=1 Tax=Tetracentron sinense TaxID=13715 RepID=A0A834ZFT7_TETSI|nr:hypothetical protein HHK36_009775 [Tetracentron sinense]